MCNIKSECIVFLRKMGMTAAGLEGRDIIVAAVEYSVQKPEASYEELLDYLEERFPRTYSHRSWTKEDFECEITTKSSEGEIIELSDLELQMLYAIECVETYGPDKEGNPPDGREVIQQFINKVCDKCTGSTVYEKLLKVTKEELKLDPHRIGADLMISMAYRVAKEKVLFEVVEETEEIQEEKAKIWAEVYRYLYAKRKNSTLEEIIQKEKKNQALEPKSDEQIRREAISKTIMNTARESTILETADTVQTVMEELLRRIKQI